MHIDISLEHGTMRLHGRFDYSTHAEFMQRAKHFVEGTEIAQLSLDLGQLEYIDSSALGMLLMMRDLAKRSDKSIALLNVKGYVRQVVGNAQFSRLFEIT